jgi:hypothetical protein
MTMLDAKTIAMLQNQANQSAARRSGKSGPRLLDDAENNVGNATILQPEILPPGQNFTVVKQSNPPRVLNLTAESKSGQSITVVMTASRAVGFVGAVGPITGIIEFGNGTQFTSFEFDIPVGPYIGSFVATSPGTQPEDSGAVIQVPTGIVRAFARYDNAYITPTFGGSAFGGPGSGAFPLPPGSGPFAPNLGLPYASFPPCPINVKAFANYFGRHHTKLYKTHYLYIGNGTSPVPFNEGGVATTYAIPPFAKSIQIIPQPAISTTLQLLDQIAFGENVPFLAKTIFQENHVITAGTYPVIPITGNTNAYTLMSTGVGDTVTGVKVIFEIGF